MISGVGRSVSIMDTHTGGKLTRGEIWKGSEMNTELGGKGTRCTGGKGGKGLQREEES